MFFGSPEHFTFLRYKVLSPQRRYGKIALYLYTENHKKIGHSCILLQTDLCNIALFAPPLFFLGGGGFKIGTVGRYVDALIQYNSILSLKL